MKIIKVDQVLPSITINDAISTEALTIYKLLNKSKKFKIKNYATNIHPYLKLSVKNIKKIINKNPDNETILLYHFSNGDPLLDKIINNYKHRVMIFHNLTPPNFFKQTNFNLYNLLTLGLNQLKKYNNKFDIILSDSLYNKKFLIESGYDENIILELPIIKVLKNYNTIKKIVKKYTSKQEKNFLFVGRIAPNKKIEDVIKTFYYYKKLFNKKSNLFIVGKYSIKNKYYLSIKYLIRLLNLSNVYFFMDINDKKLATLYKISDMFICMSEHEGFCVPLIESMYFKLPILAFNSTAVPFTLKNSGILLPKKNYDIIAEIINFILTNDTYRKKIIEEQYKIFNKYYSIEKTIEILTNTLYKLSRGKL